MMEPSGGEHPRLLGLDVGQKRIGLALSDPLGLTAGALGVLERSGNAQTFGAIEALVRRHSVRTIVVGLPLTLRGSRGPQAQKVESFANQLSAAVGVPVVFEDERLTTVQGERALIETGASRKKRGEIIDRVAAQLILQSYLDRARQSGKSFNPQATAE